MYYVNDIPYPIENYEQGIEEVKKIFNEYENSLKESENNKKQEIKDFILTYKQEYLKAESNTAKEKLLKIIQYNLREKFGIDGRSDSIASKIGITSLLTE